MPDADPHPATAFTRAMALARRYGSAVAALRELGLEMDEDERRAGLSIDVQRLISARAGTESADEALALGFLAGRVEGRLRENPLREPSSFLMNADLHCEAAEGHSILKLPWFDDGLFVGRVVPEIVEMPTPVRRLCVEHYRAALSGERSVFDFTSFGHTFSVDARPVRDDDDCVVAVLSVATPVMSAAPAAVAYESTARFFERAAEDADRDAERHGRAGRHADEAAHRDAAAHAREAAERARANACGLGAGDARPVGVALTARETDVLRLASHGLTQQEIARYLTVAVGTVRTHFENIYGKLGVNDKAAAVAMALRHGLIP